MEIERNLNSNFSNQLRVLHVIASLEFGGGTQVVFDLMNGMKGDISSSILTMKDGENTKFLHAGFSVQSCYDSLRTFMSIIRQAAKLSTYDLIHFHGSRAAIFGRIALLGLTKRPKTVYTLHGFHLPHYGFLKRSILLFLERMLNGVVDRLVCVSLSDQKQVEALRLIQHDKLRVVTNGVSADQLSSQIRKERETLRSSFGVSSEQCVFMTACRLKEPKNISVVLRAMSLLKNRDAVKFWIVGDGPDRERLEREVRELSLENQVIFLGYQTSILDYLFASDVAILSTRWEGLPLFLLEASVLKKPLVGSRVNGVLDVIEDEQAGYLFEENNEKDLAQKMNELIADPSKRTRLGNAAFERVCKDFSLAHTIQQYIELYEDLVKHN
jgi:glycosyltransferase involved in cell wall biosynthesis